MKTETSSSTMPDLIPGLIQEMMTHCNKQLELCNALEAIADSLPDQVDIQQCLHTARALYPTIKLAHDFEEKHLFPALGFLEMENNPLVSSVERLRYEHWEDESYSQEITEVLTAWAMGNANRDPEAIGYMLRGFFEGIRRHIAFECEHVIPLLERDKDPSSSPSKP